MRDDKRQKGMGISMTEDFKKQEPVSEVSAESNSELNSSELVSFGVVRGLYEWTEAIVFSLVFVMLVFVFVCRTVGVDGKSMMDTLHHGERLLVTSYPYTPKKGDIVIVNRTGQEPLVKRVIATGGDAIWIDSQTNEVRVNGEVISEPYIKGYTFAGMYPNSEETVPEGYVFVMGDNRQNSSDSREIGYIRESRIIGKAFFRIFPLDRFGKLG